MLDLTFVTWLLCMLPNLQTLESLNWFLDCLIHPVSQQFTVDGTGQPAPWEPSHAFRPDNEKRCYVRWDMNGNYDIHL